MTSRRTDPVTETRDADHRDADDLDVDYLVVGAGAMGMAFTDVLLTETDATVALVDRHPRPGGHWNVAYPFVRLHQPSSFYGVNSTPLGHDALDTAGGNRGLYELASGPEVVTYFEQVLQRRFLPSGRVRYFPMCEHLGERRWRSLVSGAGYQAAPHATVVDATYMRVTVPAMGPPAYDVASGVRCVPVNGLAGLDAPAERYVVVGAGKTGIDACLFLLANGVAPDAITWIMPRDAWLLDRATVQPGTAFFGATMGNVAGSFEAAAVAATVEDLFDELEARGVLLRFDPAVRPTMYRCGTVTRAELDELRRITDVVRLGRVRRIDPGHITLEHGDVPSTATTVHVDCSADGLAWRPPVPVFADDRITLQTVRSCQQVFSAAFIAHIEAAYDDDEAKNDLCRVVPHPSTPLDWLRSTLGNTANAGRWRRDAALRDWLVTSRLDGFSRTRAEVEDNPEHLGLLARIAAAAGPAMANLERLLADTDG